MQQTPTPCPAWDLLRHSEPAMSAPLRIGEATGRLLSGIARMLSDRTRPLPEVCDTDMAARWEDSEHNHPMSALSAARMRHRASGDRTQADTAAAGMALLDGNGPLSAEDGRLLALELTYEARAAAAVRRYADAVAENSMWVARSAGADDASMRPGLARVVSAIRDLDRARADFEDGVGRWPLWRTIGRDTDALTESSNRLKDAVSGICDMFLEAGHAVDWDPRA